MDPTKIPGWHWLPRMLAAGRLRRSGESAVLDVAWEPGEDGVLWVLTPSDGDRLLARIPVPMEGATPVATDPATGGCLVFLLGKEARRVQRSPADGGPWWIAHVDALSVHPSQGEACIAVAKAINAWPGGLRA